MYFQAPLDATYLSLQAAEIALQIFPDTRALQLVVPVQIRTNLERFGKSSLSAFTAAHLAHLALSIRGRSTIKTDCRREVIIRRAFDPTHNRTVWNLEVVNAEHQGHEPQRNLVAYLSYRALGVEEEELISTMNLAGVPAHLVLSMLRSDNPECMISSKDIQNAKQKIRESTLNGRLPVEALLDRLETEKVFFLEFKIALTAN